MRPFKSRTNNFFSVIVGILLLAFSVATQSAGAAVEVTPRIIGGEPTAPGEWSNIGFLLIRGDEPINERIFCGASLIGAKWALTAAHCFVSPSSQLLPIREVSIVFGHNDLTDTTITERSMDRLFVFPQYNPLTSDNDIALLELSEPIEGIEPIQITDIDINRLAGNPAVVIGWGATTSTVNQVPLDFPDAQQQVTVPIVSRSVCSTDTPFAGFIRPIHICAGRIQGAVDSCQGDSGSALLHLTEAGYRQAGIVSFGIGCAQPYLYGVYTNAFMYRGWIDAITNPLGAALPADDTNIQFRSAGGAGNPSPLLIFLICVAVIYRKNILYKVRLQF